MQINVDKKTGVLVAIIGALLVAILAISLNSSGGDSHSGMHGNDSMSMKNNSNSDEFTGADVMFLQMMIPHHQQAIDISNLAMKTSKDSELLALASSIIKEQSAEITQMQNWIKDADAGSHMGHSMSDMGGMLDETELSALTAATGKTFDSLWLKGMIAHHDGAVHMTMMIEDATNADIKAFGEKLVKSQSEQIAQMKVMLKRIG